jgi:hypothetical protein
MAIESDQGIAEPLGLRGPSWRCAHKASRGRDKAVECGKRFADNANMVVAMEAQNKDRRSDDSITSGDGEL